MPSELANIFAGDAFSEVSLAAAIEKLPYVPARLGRMGLFADKGIATTTAVIEESEGTLQLLRSKDRRGGDSNAADVAKRKARSFAIPHFPQISRIAAEDIQGVRLFGSTDQLQTARSVVNDRLQQQKQNAEAMLEWLRVGAIRGVILDGDGSTTLFNLFTEFSVTQIEQDMTLGTASTAVGSLVQATVRLIEDALGNTTYDHIHAFCGDSFWDKFISHPEVMYAFQYWQQNQLAREDMRGGFPYKGVIWENYRGKVGSTSYVPTADCRLVPVGVPDLFHVYYAPANTMQAANTIGQPWYASIAVDPHDRWAEVFGQTNALAMCTRPRTLARLFTSN
jgi:hypothetical protein